MERNISTRRARCVGVGYIPEMKGLAETIFDGEKPPVEIAREKGCSLPNLSVGDEHKNERFRVRPIPE
jgi:hypothetical protein